MKKAAVIFDFDGTIADTMRDNYEAWRRTFAELGAELRPHHYYPIEGMSSPELPISLGRTLGVKVEDPEALAKTKDRFYLENHSFRLFPGVEEIIESLCVAGVAIAVVTAGTRSRIQASAPKAFLEKFSALVTSDDTRRGKPAPDPYIKGAEKLSIAASDCVVVENAPLGIRSAKAAKAYCIALCQTLTAEHLTEADEVLPAFADLSSSPMMRRYL